MEAAAAAAPGVIPQEQGLSGKHAQHSSTALAAESFGVWKSRPGALLLAGHTGFRELHFEAVCRTGLAGTQPRLDVLAMGPHTVAVASKCVEYLSAPRTEFGRAYDSIKDHRRASRWYAQIALLRADPKRYRLLDAGQLVKHYLGLAHRFGQLRLNLLYLFWEPLNWERFEEFRLHRAEVVEFQQRVAGSRVALVAKSYADQWMEWEEIEGVAGHLDTLRRRYLIEV